MYGNTASGMIYIHSAIRALSPHIEWAIGRVLGTPVKLNWQDQPALPGTVRAEYAWSGSADTGAALASALHGWDYMRFEVSQESSGNVEPGRWMHTPELGIFYSQIDRAGNFLLTEDRVRAAMDFAGSNAIELQRELRLALGQPWDDELETFRQGAEENPVIWLHQVV